MKNLESGIITLVNGATNYSSAHNVEQEKCGFHIKITNLNLAVITLTFLEGNDINITSFGNKIKDLDTSSPLTYSLNNGNYFFSLTEIQGTYIGFKFDPGINTAGNISYTISKVIDI